MKRASSPIRRALIASALVPAMLLGACASDYGANDYSARSVGQISRSDSGVVVSSRPIRIEGSQSGVGVAGGAALGGLAGSEIGANDKGHAAGAIAGAILGGLLGAAAEKSATQKQGFAYTVQLDRSGEHITITQGGDYAIPNGTPVWVEYGDRARVVPKAQGYAPYPNQ